MSDSTNSTSSLFSGLRMGGFATGLDTESLVKAMASTTKSRLNRQQQKYDTLSWKQEAYRSLMTKMTTFQNNFLNISSRENCIKLPSLFKNYSAETSHKKITAIATSSSQSGSISLTNIAQLAKKAEISSASGLTAGAAIDLENLDGSKEYSVSVSLDGLAKDITFNSKESFMAEIEKNFGEGFSYANGNLAYEANDGISHRFVIQAANNSYSDLSSSDRIAAQTDSLKAIGIEGDGVSNKIRGTHKLSDLNLKTALVGDNFSFEINGKSFSFTKNSTINDIVDAVSDAKIGVQMSFDEFSQKFVISSTDTGANASVNIKQTAGNLLSAFGLGVGGGGVASASFKQGKIAATPVDSSDFNSFKAATYKITVNGKEAEIFVPTADTSGNVYDFVDDEDMSKDGAKSAAEKFVAALNQGISVSGLKGEATFSLNKETGEISLTPTKSGGSVSIASTGSEESNNFITALGFNETNSSNEITTDTNASKLFGEGSFTVGSVDITIDDTTTLGNIKSALENAGVGSIDLENGVIVANEAVTSSDTAFAEKLFGTDYATLSDPATYAGVSSNEISVSGQNAVATINGTTVTSATNSIEVNGVTLNFGNLTDAEAAAISEDNAVTTDVTRDTTKAFDAIVKFVDEYNKLIEEISKEISTSRPKSKGSYFDPLTEEQKEEMSDKEIEEWNKKAKTGLLYQDRDLDAFITSMRNALTSRTSDGFSLADIGITESDNWRDNGRLEIDAEALKTALSENPDKISEFFTDTENGLATKVEKVLNGAVSTSKSKGYGKFALLAGVEGTSTATTNSISDQLKNYKEMIDDLKTRYQSDLNRYWKRFTTLETYTANYNSIAGMFTQA
ncbi:MAG: flagellar filament capping protein FliD [Oscillospiraceae bacterium]|nr:flagellar filament capping protein FliD [Oscillospiraceae bacterium]